MKFLNVLILSSLILNFVLEMSAAPLILNEYNAVSGSNYLNGGDEFVDEDGNVPPPADPFFGRVLGNGGDWFELVVVADGLDIRGWQLEISDDGVVQPRLYFTMDPIWANLRAGTIITVSVQVPDDVSYDPDTGDWWIAVRAADPADGGTGTYVSASNFPVSNDDWQLTIYDNLDQNVFGPAGEGIVDDDGAAIDVSVNSRETFALEADPSALVARAARQYDDGRFSTFGQENAINENVFQDFSALQQNLPFPDSDGDGIADDGDRSGIAGDNSCTGGNLDACDDNCSFVANPLQADTGGIGAGAPDGIGDDCQCGDVNDDGVVTRVDAVLIVRDLQGLPPGLAAPDKCNVFGDPSCRFEDAGVIARATQGMPPGIGQECGPAIALADRSQIFYDTERVVEIDLAMDPDAWDALRLQTRDIQALIDSETCGEEPWPNPFSWFSADVTVDGYTYDNVGVRKKGFIGSLSEEKPALKLEFDRYVPGQQAYGLVGVTLNNARQDPSFVKQCISLGFFNETGIPASRCSFTRVRVNGEELGVYVNVEEVKERFLAANFADGTGKLYEGEISDFWSGPWTGTFDPDTQPAEDDNSEIVALAAVMEKTPDPDLLAELAGHVDVDQFLTYWAAEAVVAHHDGYAGTQNNYFIYLDPSVGVFQFMPWDMDFDMLSGSDGVFDIDGALARRLYNLDATRTGFLTRIQEVLIDNWQPELYEAEIDRVAGLLVPVLLDAGKELKAARMLNAMEVLRTWITNRRDFVESELAAAPASVPDVQPIHLCDLEQLPFTDFHRQ